MLQPAIVEEILKIAFDRFQRSLDVSENMREHCMLVIQKITDYHRIRSIHKGTACSTAVHLDRENCTTKENRSNSDTEWHRTTLQRLYELTCKFVEQYHPPTPPKSEPVEVPTKEIILRNMRIELCRQIISMKNLIKQAQSKNSVSAPSLVEVGRMLD